MAIKPILFSTPMVQAILEGRKTQTRRVIKVDENYTIEDGKIWTSNRFWNSEIETSPNPLSTFVIAKDRYGHEFKAKAKFQRGDILWVRESVKVGAWNYEEEQVAFDYKASPELKKTPWVEFENHDDFDKIHEQTISELSKLGEEPRIDEETETFQYVWAPGQSPLKWKPSIHMPKAAARIFLEVTNVRVERLFDISEKDAIAEGIIVIEPEEAYNSYDKGVGSYATARGSFFSLWSSINGQASLDANPWVFVYDFKRIDKPTNWPH